MLLIILDDIQPSFSRGCEGLNIGKFFCDCDAFKYKFISCLNLYQNDSIVTEQDDVFMPKGTPMLLINFGILFSHPIV